MKRIFIVIVFLSAIAFESKGQEYSAIAKEYCDCFKKMKDTMDTEFREILIRVAKQADVKSAFAKEMNGLDVSKQRMLGEQLERLGTNIESEETEAGKCGKKLDVKYEKLTDTPEKEKAFDLKVVSELKKHKDCEFLWAVSVFALAFTE